MEDIIHKWEVILHHDRNKDITYSRDVLIEMLDDFKAAVKNLNMPTVMQECFSAGYETGYSDCQQLDNTEEESFTKWKENHFV
jgi:hypothetical protein